MDCAFIDCFSWLSTGALEDAWDLSSGSSLIERRLVDAVPPVRVQMVETPSAMCASLEMVWLDTLTCPKTMGKQ